MIKDFLKTIILFVIVSLLAIFSIGLYIYYSSRNMIKDNVQELKDKNYDAIIVLGLEEHEKGSNRLLDERLKTAVELYNNGAAKNIIMSIGHDAETDDEINYMVEYAVNLGVPSEKIYIDNHGISAYDSIYRAKEIFQVEKIILVNQEYNLYRNLYISKKFGFDAIGVKSNYTKGTYDEELKTIFQEVFNMNKDFFKCIVKSSPSHLGEITPITENGDVIIDDIENIGSTEFDETMED